VSWRSGRRRHRCRRVGIWADYEYASILHGSGIGVFVAQLARGLVAADPRLVVDLVVREADLDMAEVRELADLAPGRLRIRTARDLESAGWCDPPRQGPADRFVAAWKRLAARAAGWREPRRRWLGERRGAAAGWLVARATALAAAAREGSAAAWAFGLFFGPWLLLGAWLAHAALHLGFAVLRIALFPARVLDGVVRRLPENVASAGPEAWLVPYVGLGRPLPQPAVLVVHDLVNRHFPDTFSAADDDRTSAMAEARAGEATLLASMAEFIREVDLVGSLRAPRNRTRVVRPATPVFSPAARAAAPERREAPYLLFPAGFRCYKNHRFLIEALPLLPATAGGPLELVFTGDEGMPADLATLAVETGVGDRVHALGLVDNVRLAALYRGAFATVVPSLFEQGSFPLYEALALGCPVACSRIRPLLEQCRDLGDAMLYFDPRQPAELARAVAAIAADREGVRRRQRRALAASKPRTWRQAAGEWLEVLGEVAELGPPEAGAAPPDGEPELPAARSGREPMPATRRRREGPVPVFVFLQTAYAGGVWQASTGLLLALAAVNDERGGLLLTVGLHPDQRGVGALRAHPGLRVVTAELVEVDRREAARLAPSSALGDAEAFTWPAVREAAEAALWFGLGDRFASPLLPRCPYAIVVHDVISRHLPAGFDEGFRSWWERGMVPTVRGAEAVVVANRATVTDVREAYGVAAERIHLLPTAWDATYRFAGTSARATAAGAPFVFAVANAAPHKGVLELVEAQGLRGAGASPLVVCGHDTEWFAAPPPGFDHPHWQRVRQRRKELGLATGRDVFFLGGVRDGELVDLFRRAAVVVNAAAWDSGSFSLIEGSYFGRPLVSTDYPAMRELAERFDLTPAFVPVGDAAALAGAIDDARHVPAPTLEELRARRARLAAPELGVRRRAERLHDLLVHLCGRG
jgi:glycosyltransferase involved in cell wall biosynthesis